MGVFAGNPVWVTAQRWRKKQLQLGRISGILLFLALLALLDGLQAQMREGAFQLDMLPASREIISGPIPTEDRLESDVICQIIPADGALKFTMRGFFSGYWFGNTMWRADVESVNAAPGEYKLRIYFKNAAASSAQLWTVRIFENAAAMRKSSLSWLMRWLGINPYIIAFLCGLAGITGGIATYFFGRLYAKSLGWLGLSEIYRSDKSDGSIWCLSAQSLAPQPGNARMILDRHGRLLGEARADSWQNGKLRLTMLDESTPRAGALVCLKPPRISQDVFAHISTQDQ